MNKNSFWCFLVLLLVLFSNQITCRRCYSCTGCSPMENGIQINCPENQNVCYAGQLSSGTVDQGCTSNLAEFLNTYRSLRGCSNDLCNVNNFAPINEGSFFSRSNSKKLSSFCHLYLLFFSIGFKLFFGEIKKWTKKFPD